MSQGPENPVKLPHPNWEEYFSSEPLPARDEVDPARNLQGKELAEAIENYSRSQGKEINAGQPVWLTQEYNDLLEEQIRPVAAAINQLEYAKTWASCEGHPINREEYDKKPIVKDGITVFPDTPTAITPDGRFEYDEPYFAILVDTHHPKIAELYRILEETARELTTEYKNLNIRAARTAIDARVSQLRFEVGLAVPDLWIKQAGKQSLTDMRNEIESAKKAGQLDPNDPYGCDIQRQYFSEYGEYFDTEDARKIIKSTFQAIAQAVRAKLITPKISPA